MPPDRPASRPALPAAASTLVAALVHGEPVDATVVAAHRYALYLSVRGRVLPVVTSDAVALPTAVRLAVPSGAFARLCRSAAGHHAATGPSLAAPDLHSRCWGVAPGDQVVVGAGRLALPGLDVVAARTWRPARVRRLPSSRVGCSDGRRGCHLGTHRELSDSVGDSGWLADGIRAVVSGLACSAGCPRSHVSTQVRASPRDACGDGSPGDHFRTHDAMGTAVGALVGRGPGLTPSGDDALAGALLVAHALGTGTALADAVRARLGGTTAVSAALLDAASDGYAARPVATLVDAAVAGHPDAVRRALPYVRAIGHTSGADTVIGIRAALAALGSGVACSVGCRENHLSTRLEQATGGRAA